MRSFWRRGWLCALVGVCAFVGLSNLTRADIGGEEGLMPGGNAGRGIAVGNMVFYPSVEMIYLFEDNLFKERDGKIETGAYVVRPKFMVELPFMRQYMRVGYAVEYREYDKYEMPENFTHFILADGRLTLSSGLTVTLRGRHVRSVLYTEEFDPNREVVWGNNPFRRTLAGLDINYKPSYRYSLGAGMDFNSVRFEDDTGATVRRTFFDYDEMTVRGQFNYQLTPLMAASIKVTRQSREQDRAWQGLTDDRESSVTNYYASLSGNLTPTLSGDIFAGYTRSEYEKDSATQEGDFKGLSYGINLKNRFSEVTVLEGVLFRSENQSSFLGSNYYVATGGTMTLTHRISNTTFWSVGLFYQKNTYPGVSPVVSYGGAIREDDISSIKLGLGMYFRERASMRVNYQYEERDSTIPAFSYASNRYLVQVHVGW
jgi:hypothetical protein